MVAKRIKIKRRLKKMNENDPNYLRYKAIKNALKWLCVVAYGRLGFANSTFGRINSHEVVGYIGRKMVLKAKEIAEDHGFTVLHACVDSLFFSRPEAVQEEDLQSLLDEIEQVTKLPIEVEEVYFWIAFVSSRQNPNISVANRFFGLKPDGEYKLRGIACRREDTPFFITATQLQVLQILSQEKDPVRIANLFPEVLNLVQERILALNKHTLPIEDLLVTQTLSRELTEYSVPSPLARAAIQLHATGKDIHMGQKIQFLYTKTKQGVHAWDLPGQIPPSHPDTIRYKELLFRAIHEILQPLGVSENVLRNWLFSHASYILPSGFLHDRFETPLFAKLKHMHVDLI
jgi:DNA polymerase I